MFSNKKTEPAPKEKKSKQGSAADNATVLVEPTAQALEGRVVRKTNTILAFLILASVTINAALAIGMWVLAKRPPVAGDVYAMDLDGNRVKLKAFDGSGNSTARLMNYTAEKASDILTFDYLSRESKIESMRPLFTSRGFRQYTDALELARVKDYMDSNQEIWETVVNENPVIANEKPYANGAVRKWLMQVGVLTKRLPKSKAILYERRKVTLELVQQNGGNFKIDSIGWEKD